MSQMRWNKLGSYGDAEAACAEGIGWQDSIAKDTEYATEDWKFRYSTSTSTYLGTLTILDNQIDMR